MQPNILIFMSDQHSVLFTQRCRPEIDTPNLQQLSKDGVTFDQAYTSCPLCVPARMSFLSSLYPSHTGILLNTDTLPDTTPTFLHALAAAGYETVLAGRMHFIGKNQSHGFTKRIAADMTPVSWTRPSEKISKERGVFKSAYIYYGALSVIGGGESPVLHYDDYVVEQALSYLSQPHSKPQCIVVGIYAPHFPYTAPPELYLKYKGNVSFPPLFGKTPDYLNDFLLDRQLSPTAEQESQVLAAYCGMIERMDAHIGRIRQAFQKYNQLSGRPGLFVYTSDHGDTVGDRNTYGKHTFFEGASRIPLIFAGDGVTRGKTVTELVSIMDIGPTVCEYSGAKFGQKTDGRSLVDHFLSQHRYEERFLVSQVYDEMKPPREYGTYAFMVRWKCYKYIYYHFNCQHILFDLQSDPEESMNIATKMPDLVSLLHEFGLAYGEPNRIEALQRQRKETAALFAAYEQAIGIDDTQRWQGNPPSARSHPIIQ